MQKLLELHTRFATRVQDDERGATAVEYALIVGVIGVAVATGAAALAGGIGNAFTNITNTLTGN